MKKYLAVERQHLKNGAGKDEKPLAMGTVRFYAPCPNGAEEVLRRVKEILEMMNEAGRKKEWPDEETWKTRFPEWFVKAHAPNRTKEEAEADREIWRAMTHEEQMKADEEEDWALDEWLHWMEPDNRFWYWWDGVALNDIQHVIVAVFVEDWPFPWGSLRSLFKACGATTLKAEPEDAATS